MSNHHNTSQSEYVEYSAATENHNKETALSAVEGRRNHFEFLRDFHGFFLVRYSAEAKILGFFGGALRVPVGGTSVIYTYTPKYLMECHLRGITQPDPEMHTVKGGRSVQVILREVEAYSDLLRGMDTETFDAGAWGVVGIGPNPRKFSVGGVINGTFTEEYLDPNSWRSLPSEGVAGSGGDRLTDRMAPEATIIASAMPTAWSMAMAGSFYFGGKTQKPLPAVEFAAPKLIVEMIKSEHEARQRKRITRAQQNAARRVQRDNTGGFPMLDPKIADQMRSAIGKKG